MRFSTSYILLLLTVIGVLVGEWLVYKLMVLRCVWPSHDDCNGYSGTSLCSSYKLRVLFLADPHLLGPNESFFIDKIFRDYQMTRSYRALMDHLQPDAVFVVGDLFDEGEQITGEEWHSTMQRYSVVFGDASRGSMFRVVVGNHDVGFHKTILKDGTKWSRFKHIFNASSLEEFTMNNITFVSLNSMAFEGDGCALCNDTAERLRSLHVQHDTSQHTDCTTSGRGVVKCSTVRHAVLLQHFPFYRHDELVCLDQPDGPDVETAERENRLRYDVYSPEASKLIMDSIQPRLVISGHAHHGCVVNHTAVNYTNTGVLEVTIPSFSWRNINMPGVLLGEFDEDRFAIVRCSLLRETTILLVYAMLVVVVTVCCARRWIFATIWQRYVLSS